jgi:hypothetical protein
MSFKLYGIAGATCGPWTISVVAETGFPTLDLEASSVVLRFSSVWVGDLDLTTANGLTVSDNEVTADLSEEYATFLGAGTFGAELRIVPESGVLYVLRGELKLAHAPASAPEGEPSVETGAVRIVFVLEHVAVSDADYENPAAGRYLQYNSIEQGGWILRDSDGVYTTLGGGGGGGGETLAQTLALGASANNVEITLLGAPTADTSADTRGARNTAITAALVPYSTTVAMAAADAVVLASAATDATTKANAAQAAAIAARAPGGSTTQLQYNNAGAFGGAALSYVDAGGFIGIAMTAAPAIGIAFATADGAAQFSGQSLTLTSGTSFVIDSQSGEWTFGDLLEVASSVGFDIRAEDTGGYFDVTTAQGIDLTAGVSLDLTSGTSIWLEATAGKVDVTCGTSFEVAAAGDIDIAGGLGGVSVDSFGFRASVTAGTVFRIPNTGTLTWLWPTAAPVTGTVLSASNTTGTLAFAQVTTAGIADTAVTAAKLASAVTTQIGKLNAAGTYISTLEDANAASLTVAAATDIVNVTYASGTCALNVSALATGQSYVVMKNNTSANGITVVGGGSDTINGGSAGASMTLPSSTTVSSSTTGDVTYFVLRTGATTIRVS